MITKQIATTQSLILDALQERGYRSTQPRQQMAAAIAAERNHFTAEGLRQHLPASIGRATVFRTLKILVEAGVICRVLLEDGNLHYQLSEKGHHHHLLCVECGSSHNLAGCDIEDTLASASQRHGFKISGHWLEVYGRCIECAPSDQALRN